MKKLSKPEQRRLYTIYKEARLNQAFNLIALYNTGTYNNPGKEGIINRAKSDILKFVSCFEEDIKNEAVSDLGNI